jgi:hypothetical protein
MVEEHSLPCFLCERRSPHGRYFPAWKMTICQTCYHSNWNGVMPPTWPHLLPYLEKNGYGIEYSDAGSLRWPATFRTR